MPPPYALSYEAHQILTDAIRNQDMDAEQLRALIKETVNQSKEDRATDDTDSDK